MMTKRNAIIAAIVILALAAAMIAPNFGTWAFALTGEEQPLSQVRGLMDLAGDAARPALDLRPNAAVTHTNVNPYGINTFLQQEVEPAKREKQVQLIAEAGFHWLRQEFPWYDIEISAKGNFEDCRFPPCHSAWDKYDEIVGLSEEYGLEIIVRLSSPPSWSRADGDARGPFAPPDSVADYADYAAAVAERYKGRVTYFQIWNEPNIYPEWGEQAVNPEGYTDLLCAAYAAIKQANPDAVVLAGAVAPTNELTGDNLNEFIFLQRMYDSGAAQCFDIMSVQGYGLWSGPTDHRLDPITVNYNRHVYIRDLMVRNGDEHKAIWISEMNWNTVPDEIPDRRFGQVTLDQQARWAPLAYERAANDWPWVGVVSYWFFKQADESVRDQSWYYFRMADPDFTLMPVYETMKKYIAENPYVP
jgi:polysaccharide biosynthesis protein PslG